MFDIQINKDLIDHCKKQLENCNFGKRTTDTNGTKEQQLVGLIGESAIRKAFGHQYVKCGNDYNIEYDFIYNTMKVDVKTMGRTSYPTKDYVNNLMGEQIDYECDRYIFCSYHKVENVLTVCGFIDKQTLLKKANKYLKGETRTRFDGTEFVLKLDLYEIKNSDLEKVYSMKELKLKLDFVI